MVDDEILDDIWAEEAGISVRFAKLGNGALRIELTSGVGMPPILYATLLDWRAKRATKVLAETFLHSQDKTQP